MPIELLESRRLLASISSVAMDQIGAVSISHTGTLSVAGLPTNQRLEVVSRLGNDVGSYLVRSENAARNQDPSGPLFAATNVTIYFPDAMDELQKATLHFKTNTTIPEARSRLAALTGENHWFSIRSMNFSELVLVDRTIMKRAQIDLGGGTDFINIVGNLVDSQTTIAMTVLGGNGDDTLLVASDDALVSGGSGNDDIRCTQTTGATLLGSAGNDFLLSNVANSLLDGGAGIDSWYADSDPGIHVLNTELTV
ncbi:MAG TPA: hypothetical protein VHS31_19220 [Tepidisphaeraceae bacterium]|jgi:hypothetical protein|nr:hypothetical protein [Tepidisphaeraceae bacterium]